MLRRRGKITFKVAICVENDNGGFHAYCPALAGVHVNGATEGEALENAKTAALLYLKSLIKHEEPIPLQMISSLESQETYQGSAAICPPQQIENVLITV